MFYRLHFVYSPIWNIFKNRCNNKENNKHIFLAIEWYSPSCFIPNHSSTLPYNNQLLPQLFHNLQTSQSDKWLKFSSQMTKAIENYDSRNIMEINLIYFLIAICFILWIQMWPKEIIVIFLCLRKQVESNWRRTSLDVNQVSYIGERYIYHCILQNFN